MPSTSPQMKDHNFLIGGLVAINGYLAAGLSWLNSSVVFLAVDPEAVKLWGPLAIALLTALLGKGVDVWLKLREEKRSRTKE